VGVLVARRVLPPKPSRITVLSIGVWPEGGEIDAARGSLVKIPKGGGAITVLADHLNKPRDLSVDSIATYRATNDGTWNLAKAGGKPERSTAPAPTYLDDPFEKALVVGKTRYHVVNKDSHATLTAEPLQ